MLATAPPISRYTRVGELTLHYLTWGTPSQPVLVLLHGGGQSAHTWHRVAARLQDRYYVVAPDARGHGDSAWAADRVYTIDALREDLRGFAGNLGLADFVLIGMSLGGMTALSYAGSYGATLRGLVVIDIAPQIEPAGRDRIVGFLTGRQTFTSVEEAVDYAHAFNPRRDRATLHQTLPRNLRTLPDGQLRWKWDPAFLRMADTAEPAARSGLADLQAAAARVSCPALVIHGAESDILSRSAGEQLAWTLPHGQFVSIDGAGHGVQGDNPHRLSETLEQFLTRIGY